jgi:hypothetical protein
MRDVELELMRRARLCLQEGVDDIWTHLAEHSDEQLPALVVVCDEPAAAQAGVIQALGEQVVDLGAAVLTSGATQSSARLAVHVGASIELETDLPLPTVLEPLSLDVSARREAIEVIRDAYPTEPEEDHGSSIETVESDAPPPVAVRAATPPRPVAEGERRSSPPSEPPVPAPQMIAIRCLGPFEISRGDAPMRTGWKSKGRELLAYLVANPSGAPKERIIDELWPEVDPKTAAARFDRYATLVRSLARGTEDSRVYVERVGESSYRLEQEHGGSMHGSSSASSPTPTAATTRPKRPLGSATRLRCTKRAMAIEGTIGRRAAALVRYRKFEIALDEQLSVEPDPETQKLLSQLVDRKEKAG